MERAFYEADPFNRLIISYPDEKGELEKFRQVLDGQFKVDGNNNLSYHVKAPLDESENIPHQVTISGDWSLTDKHELRLTLDKEGRETFGDKITLQGQILDVGKDSLLFSMTTKTDTGGQMTYILNLQGFWRANENNRLSFYVRREDGSSDILTFNGAWEINKNYQIIYRYEKAALIRKKREVHELVFKGHWDIKKKLRISYLVDGSSDSEFDFEASAGILAEDYVKYEIGIEAVQGGEPVTRALILSGEWKLEKDIGLLFEVEYEDGEVHAIIFGADAELTDNDTILFRLKSGVDNEDLGMELELSHSMPGNAGEAFLRAIASKRELACYAGTAWRW